MNKSLNTSKKKRFRHIGYKLFFLRNFAKIKIKEEATKT